MKEEQKGTKNSKNEYTEYHEDNAPEMESIVNQMQEEA